MRFLTYNLWHGLSPSATPVAFEPLEPTARRELREERQETMLQRLAPDVAFFQEANPLVARAGRLSQALHMNCNYQPDLVGTKLFGIGIPFNLNSGMVTAVGERRTLKVVDTISLTRPGLKLVRTWASWQLREERFALFSETLLPGFGRVLLVNTHLHHGLEATPDFLQGLAALAKELDLNETMMSELTERIQHGNQRRMQEMSVLLARLKELESRYEVVVLAGDLNATPGNEMFDGLRERGFVDVWAEAHGQEPGFTFDSKANYGNHLLQSRFPLSLTIADLSFSSKIIDRLMALARGQESRPRRIDYLWVRSNTLRLKVSKAELVGLPDGEGFAPSDHFGVCADLEVV